jgi:trehalose 6-phosphate phosphatase
VKSILGNRQRPILERFLQPGTLIAFDFDGTLAPIVPDPSSAAMRSRTRLLFERLAARYACTVISGRVRKDVLARVRGVSLRAVFGNHGIEPISNPREIRALVRRWKTRLERLLPSTPGLVLEDKGVSLSLHYRQANHRAQVRRLLLDAAERLPGSRILDGKMVVNVLPARADDKASALTRLRARLGCRLAIYVGDDENDEGVFALVRQGWLLGIRVGRSSRSQAQFFLPGQSAVDALLRQMLWRKKPPL